MTNEHLIKFVLDTKHGINELARVSRVSYVSEMDDMRTKGHAPAADRAALRYVKRAAIKAGFSRLAVSLAVDEGSVKACGEAFYG